MASTLIPHLDAPATPPTPAGSVTPAQRTGPPRLPRELIPRIARQAALAAHPRSADMAALKLISHFLPCAKHISHLTLALPSAFFNSPLPHSRLPFLRRLSLDIYDTPLSPLHALCDIVTFLGDLAPPDYLHLAIEAAPKPEPGHLLISLTKRFSVHEISVGALGNEGGEKEDSAGAAMEVLAAAVEPQTVKTVSFHGEELAPRLVQLLAGFTETEILAIRITQTTEHPFSLNTLVAALANLLPALSSLAHLSIHRLADAATNLNPNNSHYDEDALALSFFFHLLPPSVETLTTDMKLSKADLDAMGNWRGADRASGLEEIEAWWSVADIEGGEDGPAVVSWDGKVWLFEGREEWPGDSE
ncbi:hypothetical protein JCM10213_002999 [Rhodosporidiobolus nylandii]